MHHDIGLLRSNTQHIAQADFAKPEDVVRHLLAMQAQDYNDGLWSVGLRMKSPSRQAVEKAIADHAIIRSWPMRGTLHLMHADDAKWLIKLLAPRATQTAKTRRLGLGLTDEALDEIERHIRTALKGGKAVRRDILLEVLKRKTKTCTIGNEQSGHILRNFGERGIICFGPHDAKQPTFVLLDEWVSGPARLSGNSALKELAIRYFMSHGPATLKDFAGWGMMTLGMAREALSLAQDALCSVDEENTTYYLSPDQAPAKRSGDFLLPGFDEYILGYKDRRAMLADEYSQRIVTGNNGMFLPTIIRDGRVIGTWKRSPKKKIEIVAESFEAETMLAIEKSQKRYEQFLTS